MLVTPVVLAVLLPALQQAVPPAAPTPKDSPSAGAASDMPAASTGAAQPHLDAGLAAFKKRRFAKAEIEFRKAADAEPQSAAAAFYLGYTYYKIAEPKRHDHPDKQKAAELFAKAYAIDPSFKPVWHSAK
jgi:tetratricopeptide (TPR) repeat protein